MNVVNSPSDLSMLARLLVLIDVQNVLPQLGFIIRRGNQTIANENWR